MNRRPPLTTKTEQLSLFKVDVLFSRQCPRCSRPIMTVRQGDHIVSEYSDAEGRCWTCCAKR